MNVLAVPARVESLQVGRPRDYVWLGRPLRSGIDKRPVTVPLAATHTGLEGDGQADTRQHGGRDKAVYAYAMEDVAWWSTLLGRELGPAAFGENLTTRGLRLTAAVIGEHWHVGSAVLQVSEPRTPCWKLGMRFGDTTFPRALPRARRPGVLLRVLREGRLPAGDRIEVGDVPDHGVRATDVSALYYGDGGRILAAPELAGDWPEWAAHRTVWHDDEDRRRTREDRQRMAEA